MWYSTVNLPKPIPVREYYLFGVYRGSIQCTYLPGFVPKFQSERVIAHRSSESYTDILYIKFTLKLPSYSTMLKSSIYVSEKNSCLSMIFCLETEIDKDDHPF
jgi:hypothetical protein